MTHPLASEEHILCGVCRAHAGPHGYKPTRREPAICLCDDKTCQSPRQKGARHDQETLDAYAHKAAKTLPHRGYEIRNQYVLFQINTVPVATNDLNSSSRSG